ncbi:hypothetical protein C1A40_16235 [Tamlana carrageenivorans]|uniref:Uncharacterized protein n=2 Tax=Pseudotamlana carrageenivorans TaxID=2069432 RepID=A0A2I7SM00_9FLAO|nr:hypothetical protein C1A40_16235 [Tamlana carrageenivorans]
MKQIYHSLKSSKIQFILNNNEKVMKFNLTIISLLILFCSCKDKVNNKLNPEQLFEDSYKTQRENNSLEDNSEHFDKTKNIYSNYKYNVAYDGLDYWVSDYGVSEHTILRTFDKDSAIGMTINVIETTFEPGKNIWEIYDLNPKGMEEQFSQMITGQLNTDIKNYSFKKTYIKNVKSLKRKFEHTVRDSEYEYDNVSIMQQAVRGNYYYTFNLFIPTRCAF